MKNIALIVILFLLLKTSGLGQDTNTLSLDSLLNLNINTASKYDQKTSEAPSYVSVVTALDIERFGYSTLGEVLHSLAGFYTTYDRNYLYLGTRGFSRPTDYNDRILILINGHPLNENFFGSAPIGTDLGLSLSSIDRIEVVRGPGSALYGTGAMFAVINIMTKDGKSFDKSSVILGCGSQRRYSGTINFGKEFETGLDVFLSTEYYEQAGDNLYFPEFDSPQTNNGIASNVDEDNYISLFTSITYHDFKLHGKYSKRSKLIPTSSYGTLFNDKRAKSIDAFNYIDAEYTLPVSENQKLTLSGNIDYYYYSGGYPYEAYMTSDANDGIWSNLTVQYNWESSSSNIFIVGGEYKNNLKASYKTFEVKTEVYNKNTTSTIFSAYLQDEFTPIEHLSLLASIRYDNYSVATDYVSPRSAIIYSIPDGPTLKLIYGSSFRLPNLYELYYEDILTKFKPNPSLNPEKISTVEFVSEYRFFEGLYGIVSFHSYHVHNLIDQRFDPVDSSLQFNNYSKVTTDGFEADLNYSMSFGMKAYLRYSYQYAKDVSMKNQLSNSPKHLLNSGINYPISKDFNLALEVFYETGRITVYNTTTNDFFLTNLTFSCNKLFNIIKPSLSINNLFNVSYALPGGFEHIQPAIKQDGRTFFFRIQFDF